MELSWEMTSISLFLLHLLVYSLLSHSQPAPLPLAEAGVFYKYLEMCICCFVQIYLFSQKLLEQINEF